MFVDRWASAVESRLKGSLNSPGMGEVSLGTVPQTVVTDSVVLWEVLGASGAQLSRAPTRRP